MSGSVDTVDATGRAWDFGDEVTDAFDDMLRRSIPQYDVMRRTTFDLGRRFVQHGTTIMDLGASRGEAVKLFLDSFGATVRYDLVERSAPMLEVLRERFGEWPGANVHDMDLRYDFPPGPASLILSVLTLQFTPIEYRLRILARAYRELIPGGAMILVEKVLGYGELDDHMVSVYYALKKENGYSEEQIEAKRRSLEGVLVPVTASMNEEFLRMTGFRKVDCFWRWMNFAGWIAVRE